MKRVLFLLLALSAGTLEAQVPGPPVGASPSSPLSFGGTLGFSLGKGEIPLGIGASMSARRNNRSLRLSLNGATNVKETATMNALALALGVHNRAGQPHVSAFAGPSVIWGRDEFNRDQPSDSGSYVTAGLAAEVTALFGSTVQFGLGVWGNLNPRFSTIGVGPRLHIRLN
jgi:hypothetical protein